MMDKRWEEELSHITQDWVIGADDVGTGALAGPCVCCAILAPKSWTLEGLNDSKALSKKRREEMRAIIGAAYERREIGFAIAERSNLHIDHYGITQCLSEAFSEAIATMVAKAQTDLKTSPYLIVDGARPKGELPANMTDVRWLPKADNFVPQVMAASILAKCYRDEKMAILGQLHPEYRWAENSGYGTKDHKAALKKIGVSPLHRFSYEPVKSMVK
jgi:ribonuclease HII